MPRKKKPIRIKLQGLVEELANPFAWNWTKGIGSERTAADAVLRTMVKHGLIGHRNHPLGGDVWIINGKLFGRTDDLPASFLKPKQSRKKDKAAC